VATGAPASTGRTPIKELVEVHYPDAERIVLVQDNPEHPHAGVAVCDVPAGRGQAASQSAGAALHAQARQLVEHGYAPELNPDEWVWRHVKCDRIGRAGVSGPEDLKAKALAALHRLQKLPHLVQGFFRDPSLRYITA
jgi:hypothetical protein